MRGTSGLFLTISVILLLPAGSAMSQIKEILEFTGPSRNGPVTVKGRT